MKVRTDFEGGRIEVVSISESRLTLRVLPDLGAPKFRQHFAFDVVGCERGQLLELSLENGRDCTWGDTFGGLYRVYVADGRERWMRAPTHYEAASLRFSHVARSPRCRFAYTPPYPSERLDGLVRRAVQAGARWKVLARTPHGRPLGQLVLGTRHPAAPELWLIAQQHPGEAMAGWFVEGFVEALLPFTGRPTTRASLGRPCRSGPEASPAEVLDFLAKARVHIVPCMNPDGVAAGNHRTTPGGIDLNRVWNEVSPPVEVAAVRAAMQRDGVDLLVDAHGDERLPFVFTQAADSFPGRPAHIAQAQRQLEQALLEASPDYQTDHHYSYDPGGRPNLQLATNWAQRRFGCLALVLEMPFSDNANAPEPGGWHPGRSKAFGRAFARALGSVVASSRLTSGSVRPVAALLQCRAG